MAERPRDATSGSEN